MTFLSPMVRLHLVQDRVNGGLHIRLWENLGKLGPGVHELYSGPVELEGVTAALAEGGGFWATCSGCYETEDGYPVGSYPYSRVMQCTLGAGCSECGGIGALWDTTDYDELARLGEEELEAGADD